MFVPLSNFCRVWVVSKAKNTEMLEAKVLLVRKEGKASNDKFRNDIRQEGKEKANVLI